MKDRIKFELELSRQKLENLRKQSKEIEKKINSLSEHLHGIEKSISNEENKIKTLGIRNPRRDGKPENPEKRKIREEYNLKLQEEKKDFFPDLDWEEEVISFPDFPEEDPEDPTRSLDFFKPNEE